MKKYLAQLRPMERRLVVGVLVVLVVVLNAVFIWPHFSDWGNLRHRLDDAHRKLKLYQTTVAQIPALQADVGKFESEGETVAPEDQGINFMRAIQSQSAQSGVAIQNISRQLTHTSDAFFIEQVVNINVLATEEQLVDFLYKLGSGASMIRVRDLELQPDAPHQRLTANIRLVASYQKNSPSAANNSTAMAP
jgi:Tfp pilus assembly protein PilO